MEKIVKDFLDSGLTEAEFYNLPMDDLYNLRDYLCLLRGKDAQFRDLIKAPVDSMRGKCDWINDVTFNALQSSSTGKYLSSTIWLIDDAGTSVITKKDKESGKYQGLAQGQIPFVYRLSKNVRELIKRYKELDLIQGELGEIDQIGRSVYDGWLVYRTSASGKISINYFPNVEMTIWNDADLLAAYSERKSSSIGRPIISKEEREAVLSRIQVRL